MPIGRNCVDHYRQLSRYCVFSHDEMVCNMALKADTMDVELASGLLEDMTIMIQEERELREKINKMVRRSRFQFLGCHFWLHSLLCGSDVWIFVSRVWCSLDKLITRCSQMRSGSLEELHSLLEQAETKAFPKISLLDHLSTVTSEADKVAVMAQQLLNGKRQTRY
ncbi:hypothetical protein GOODEAATRI_008471 [Goodea atripinnis]|uniref:Uncharacterized protein n=1 Tax=Goodea atripinnis TaxID=208336 RepID=A0ABV0P4G1_9TELE